MNSLGTCALAIVVSLEARVFDETRRIRAKYPRTNDLDFLLAKSKESWDLYRNNHCFVEGVLDRKGELMKSELEQSRQFTNCVIRTLQQRIAELEAL